MRYFEEYPLDEIVTLAMTLKREHGAAWIFYTGDYSNITGNPKTCTIPKSICEWDAHTNILSLPRWLAHRKGLI